MKDILKPRTLIAFAFYGTYLAMVLCGIDIPKTLENLVISLMAFYFGSKSKGLKNEQPNKS